MLKYVCVGGGGKEYSSTSTDVLYFDRQFPLGGGGGGQKGAFLPSLRIGTGLGFDPPPPPIPSLLIFSFTLLLKPVTVPITQRHILQIRYTTIS